jgi:hypothetical protein
MPETAHLTEPRGRALLTAPYSGIVAAAEATGRLFRKTQ